MNASQALKMPSERVCTYTLSERTFFTGIFSFLTPYIYTVLLHSSFYYTELRVPEIVLEKGSLSGISVTGAISIPTTVLFQIQILLRFYF